MSTPTQSPTLTRQILVRVAIRIAIVIVIATVIGYFHVSSSLQRQALAQLKEYIQQRGVRESSIFVLAEDNLRAFARDYTRRLNELGDTDCKTRFGELFITRADGTTRLREELFDTHKVTGVIGKQVHVDADLRRRLVLGFDMLSAYGPAWRNRFVNLYITTPENAILNVLARQALRIESQLLGSQR